MQSIGGGRRNSSAGGTIAAFCIWAMYLTGSARLCATEPSNAPIHGRSKNANAAARPSLVRPAFIVIRLTRFACRSAPRLAGCEVQRFMVLAPPFGAPADCASPELAKDGLYLFPSPGRPARAQLPVHSSGQQCEPLWAYSRRVAIAASASSPLKACVRTVAQNKVDHPLGACQYRALRLLWSQQQCHHGYVRCLA